MTVYLVRHAKAGDRATWEGDDRLRPLTKRGRRQAEGIASRLGDATFDRLVSSPYVRCLETLVPLASARTQSLEVADGLLEGATLDEAMALLTKHADGGAVLCSHGDVIPMLLGHLAARGVDLGSDPQWAKGSTWVLEHRAGEVTAARYVPPPPDGSADAR